MKFVNLTGNTVSIMNEQGHLIVSYPPKGLAKCEIQRVKVKDTGPVPVYSMMYGEVKGLPKPEPGSETLYIVDEIIADAAKSYRFDLVVPGKIIKTEKQSTGVTKYCKELINVM